MKCVSSRTLLILLASFIALPVLVVSLSWLLPFDDIWYHFQKTLLSELMLNTLILLSGVAVGVSILGTLLAWLVVMTEFPGRKYLEWALLLPFAIPAYVLAFVYLGLFDYASPTQDFLRNSLGINGFDLRTNQLALISTFVLVFYPYVYIMSRAAFKRQQSNIIASARLLGANMWQVFWRMAFPLARPAIAAGVLVTMMETMADFGVVSLFNYDTLTTAIYSAWGDFRSVKVAAQLATILVFIAAILIYLEGYGRRKIKYYGSEVSQHRPYRWVGYKSYLITFFVLFILFLSFILPLMQLIIWAYQSFDTQLWIHQYTPLIFNTLILSLLATILIIGIANILSLPNYCLKKHFISNISIKIATLGYAVPGSVMAIGLLYGVNGLSNFSQTWFGINFNQYLFGSIGLLLFAYVSRFIAVAYQPISVSAKQIKPSITNSAQLLGAGYWRSVIFIQIPLMLPGIIGASLLVLIDIMKELPATYILRPFGWDTLAINIYELSSDALYEQASIPALILVLLATGLIIIFQRFDKRISN